MKSRLIVMDEPTSALSEAEVANLASIVRALKAEGLSIIFVTHRLEEVFRLCDRYTVLRDGHFVGAGEVAETNVEAIIRLMVGRNVELVQHDRPAPTPGAVALEVKGLTRRRTAPGVCAGSPVGEDPPGEHEAVLAVGPQLGERPEHLVVDGAELGLDVSLVARSPDQRRVTARTEQQADRVREDRLAGSGLARDRRKLVVEHQLRLVDQHEVLDPQRPQHEPSWYGQRPPEF